MMQEKVLVVGGAGYVGAHTCKALHAAGYLPVTFDNLSTGHRDFVRWGPLVVGDIRDSNSIRDTIEKHEISGVLHFAACAYVGESVVNPQKYYDNNVLGTLSLLKGMLEAGCNNIVFSSTCAVYGQPDKVPISEETTRNPVNPYGASKLMVERILSDYQRAYDLNWIALRYFNASGADPDGEIGELRDPETHLIPRAIMSLQGYIDDFQVFGADFPTPDGTAVRDYIHVADLASAHVAALLRLREGFGGVALNLGTETGYSVKAVLDAIEREAGEKLPAVDGPRREGDPATLVADATEARRVLDFRPRHSDLETIVRTAWAWHRKAHPRRNAPPGSER
jgi:UDP-glucose-4-epimerase GalE